MHKLVGCTVLLSLFVGCATRPFATDTKADFSIRKPTSEWRNILACTEGLRIDERADSNHQIVLFGAAAEHFIQAGAIARTQLNDQGEYVSFINPQKNSFMAILKDGFLRIPPFEFQNRSSYAVQWVPYSGSPNKGTDFVFYQCR